MVESVKEEEKRREKGEFCEQIFQICFGVWMSDGYYLWQGIYREGVGFVWWMACFSFWSSIHIQMGGFYCFVF